MRGVPGERLRAGAGTPTRACPTASMSVQKSQRQERIATAETILGELTDVQATSIANSDADLSTIAHMTQTFAQLCKIDDGRAKIGLDAEGRAHVLNVQDEVTVEVHDQDDGVVQSTALRKSGKTLGDWIAFVDEQIGWDERYVEVGG